MEGRDKEIELIDKRFTFSAEETGISNGEFLKQMEHVNVTEILDKIIKIPNKTLKKHKQIDY